MKGRIQIENTKTTISFTEADSDIEYVRELKNQIRLLSYKRSYKRKLNIKRKWNWIHSRKTE